MDDNDPQTGIDDCDASSAASVPAGSKHPRLDTTLLALVLIAASVLLALSLVDPSVAVRPSGIWVTVAILAAFAAVEFSVFRFTFRRESLAFSLSEIPLAFSLVYLGLWPAIAVRIVGAMSMIMLVRRPPPYKAALNVGMFAFEMCLAFVVFRGIVDLADTGNTVVVVAAIAATAICGVVSSMIVSIAISRFEGGLWQRIGSELSVAWWLFIVNATLAGMVLGLALISPWLLLVATVPIGLLWYIIKAYGAIDQRLRDLNAVHGFTGRVGQSLDPREIGHAAIVEAARLLRTEGAALVLFDHRTDPVTLVHGVVDVVLPETPDDPAWSPLFSAEELSLIHISEPTRH